MTNFIRTLFDSKEEIRLIANEMKSMSQSFTATGNDLVADRLVEWAIDIECSIERIMNAHAAHLNQQVIGAQEASTGLLKAILAGVIRSPENQAIDGTTSVAAWDWSDE